MAPVGSPALLSLVAWVKTGQLRPESAERADQLIREATTQRLAPLLYAAVMADAEAWPAPAIERLRDLHHASFARGARQLDLAARLMNAFDGAGLRVLPMKGVALAESAYESVAERPMGDIDLLALDDWSASVRVLEEAGLVAGARADHAWVFRDPRDDVAVELHHSVVSCPGLFRIDASALWEASVEASGQVPRRPSDEDLLVQLSLHAAFQHGLVLSLVQYLDFRRLAERVTDRERLERLAASMGTAVAVSAALAAATAVAGAELPGWPRGQHSRSLARWLESRLADPTLFLLGKPASIARLRWELAAGRRWALVRGTLAPTVPGPRPSPIGRADQVVSRVSGLASRWL